MAKKQPSRNTRRSDKRAGASSVRCNEARPDENPARILVDAVAEIVHQGYGRLFDAGELRVVLDGWKPNCSMNFEYVFAWNPSFDLSALEINWNRPQLRILRRLVKGSKREQKILSGSPMTTVEQQAYRLELARRKHGYQSAQECLDSGINCKWVDLSFITDSNGRDVFILEMADAVAGNDEVIASIIEPHQEMWQWKSQPLTTAGPFTSSDEAEKWMAHNGAFKGVD